MRMSFSCIAEHGVPSSVAPHGVRVQLERGYCPICPDHELDGLAFGGLEAARCPCCGSEWRLEPEGFALRPGRVFEEWS
jgi:hypothetical protein